MAVKTMTEPWTKIVERYKDLSGDDLSLKALLALSEHIANGPLARGLFAWVSMFDLCITQTEVTYPYDGPHLRVSPTRDGFVEFRYVDTWQTDKQWHGEVPGHDAIAQLLKFLEWLRWFPPEVLR